MVLARLHDQTIEIRDVGDLLRVAKRGHELRASLTILDDDGMEVVIPPSTRASRPRHSNASETDKAHEEFRAAAGSLAGLIDPEDFMRQVREGRRAVRPPVSFDLLDP